MKTGEERLAVSALCLAVQGALLAMSMAPTSASAQEEGDVQALVSPTNFVELGVLNVSKDSSKFGEYNGLNESGPYAIGNFELGGGDAYGMGSGTRRWHVFGSNLGTTSRAVGGSVTDQGRWSIGIGFDQLRHYTTNGDFETPYVGKMGGNNFSLPRSFGVINTTTSATNGVLTSASKGTQTLTDGQLAAFHKEDVRTERQNTSFAAGYAFNPQWSVKFDFNRLNQSGAKLISSATDAFNLTSSGGFNYGGERIAVLMNPTNYRTDTYNFALDWVGEKAHLSASYFASLFQDSYNGLSWSNPFVAGGTGAAPNPPTGTVPSTAFPIDTMSTPPSNEFHQLNLSGGYNFSTATKLAGSLSYGRNSQNESYAGTYTTTPNTVPGLPVSSLEGLVITTHADAKLTHQATKSLGFSAGVKYNERDNQTDSHTYSFFDLGGQNPARNLMTVVNIPMSNRRVEAELAGDYRIDARQHVRAAYEYDQYKRWCNNSLANNAQGDAVAGYYTTASCVQVPRNRENRFALTYRLRAGDSVDFNAGYTYGRRTAKVNSAFYNPMQANSQGFENFGYLAFFDASRRSNQFKAGIHWQATDKFDIGFSGRYVRDDYDSTLGVQNGETSSLNVDATYAYSSKQSISAYASWQKRTRDLLSANGRDALAPLPNLWTNSLSDEDNTVGIGARQKALMHGRLELAEDLTYSLSKSSYSTEVQYLLTGNAAIGNLSFGDTPDIKSELTQFKITGSYQVDKASKVILGYLYQRLKSNDYYYNAYQYGFTPTTLLPTNQRAPNYNVNTVLAVFNYSFQ